MAEHEKPRRIPLREFFRNPERTSYLISPDGKWISFLSPYERRKNIFIVPRAGGEARRLTEVTDRDIGGYFWKGNEHIVYLRDFGGDENFHLFSVTMNGSVEQIDLTPFPGVRVDIVDDLEDHPTDMLISTNERSPEVFDVYRINVATGAMRLVAENPGNIVQWSTDHDGSVRIAVTSDGVNSTLLFRSHDDDSFRAVITTSFKETLSPLFFTFDNAKLYALSNLGRDKAALVIFDPATAKETEALFEHPEVDVSNLFYSRKRKALTAITYITDKLERKFLDAEIENIFRDLTSKLPGYELSLAGWNKDEDIYIVRTYSDRSLGAYYVYETVNGNLTKLADVSPWLHEDELAEVKPIRYTSRDGLVIHGYLALPVGYDPKNLPVVVNPHGGPWVRDTWGYNPEVQFFANRGYAVLKVNYRGSTGYGRKFWEASFKQWGKAMQDDVTDGVRWLIEQGIADPKRIAIYGGSYGGYCTLAGLTFTPEIYKCGIDYVGVSNLFTFMNTIPPYWKPYLEMMYEMVGHPERDKDYLEASSPVFHVDKIVAPLMVLQGAKDPRVNIDESNQIVEALRARGIDVPYIVRENEGHGFHNEENRFDAYEAMEAFLEKHLSNGRQ